MFESGKLSSLRMAVSALASILAPAEGEQLLCLRKGVGCVPNTPNVNWWATLSTVWGLLAGPVC